MSPKERRKSAAGGRPSLPPRPQNDAEEDTTAEPSLGADNPSKSSGRRRLTEASLAVGSYFSRRGHRSPSPNIGAQAQEDFKEGIGRYHTFLRTAWREGSRGPPNDHSVDAEFIPYHLLQAFFDRENNLGKILQELFPFEWPTGLTAGQVQSKCLRGLSILLRIGDGPMIARFVQHHELHDKSLPLRYRPESFPSVSGPNGDDLFARFCEAQLAFTAPILEYQPIFRYHADTILPIRRVEALGIVDGQKQGHTSDIFKVEVEAGYDRLINRIDRKKGPNMPVLHSVYVTKTFTTRDAEADWEQELKAFISLKQHERSTNNLIGFFGSFCHGNVFTLILEYADQGTLEDFFNRDQPSDAAEILELWTALLGLTNALQTLHSEGRIYEVLQDRQDDDSALKGVHQDVKPSNILVCSRQSPGFYSYVFKLADLGSSHFKPKSQPSGEREFAAIERRDRGTRTYGAPESYMPDGGMVRRRVEHPSRADVWSLGAIFSEAATWAILGRNRLSTYRAVREQVTESLDLADIGCFHYDDAVLPEVLTQHRMVLDQRRRQDVITEPVVCMINWMLQPENTRLTAEQLCRHATRILAEANRNAGPAAARGELSRAPASYDSRTPRTPPSQSEPSRTPPPSAHGDVDRSLPFRQDSQRSLPAGFTAPGQINTTFNHVEQRYITAETTAQNQNVNLPSPPHSPQVTSHRYNDSMESTTSSPPLPPRMPRRAVPPDQSPSIAPFPTFGHDPRATLQPQTSDASLPRSRTRSTSGCEKQDRISLESQQEEHPQAVRDEDELIGSKSPAAFSPATVPPYPPWSEEDDDSFVPKPLRKSDTTQTQRVPLPVWPAEEAIDWNKKRMDNKKTGKKTTAIKHEHELKHLDGRDIVFLVDTAGFMEPYWPEVGDLLGLIGYLVKQVDGANMEAQFTQSHDRRPVRSKQIKNVNELLTWHKGLKPPADYNMPADVGGSLSKIMDEYREKLGDKQGFFGQARQTFTTTNKKIVYVFTDGRWQVPRRAEMALKNLTDRLHDLGKPSDQFTVQFIQFGSNRSGTELLGRYDRGEGYKRNIVDRVASHGNTWRILLGSILETYDRDEEAEASRPTSSHDRNVSFARSPSTV